MVCRRPVCTDSGSLRNDNATTLLLALFMTDLLEINDNLTASGHFCQGRICFQSFLLVQQPVAPQVITRYRSGLFVLDRHLVVHLLHVCRGNLPR